MLKVLQRPYAKPEDLLKTGTDLEFEGRFKETLAFNHFNRGDAERLREVAHILDDSMEEASQILTGYLKQIALVDAEPISAEMAKGYMHTFFHVQRDERYVERILSFFETLKNQKYNLAKLSVAFNQLNFYFITKLLSKKALSPHVCLALMESLQKGMNIDQQILIEVYTENQLEDLAQGISSLMNKNGDIMFIRDLLKKIEQQHMEAQNVTAATEQMTASIAEVADSASSMAEITDGAVHKASKGQEVITSALDEIIHTEETFATIVNHFNQWKDYIGNIEDVVKLISDIADQTNLLALNASIEAARAGEHGKGFAVVANEVRNLSENTLQSLQEVNESVTKLAMFSDEASNTIHSLSAEVKKGAQEASEAVPFLDEIVEDVEKINVVTTQVASTTQEQAAAIDDVAYRMVSITDLSDEVKKLGYDTGEAVHGLSQLTESFRNNIFSANVHLSTRSLLELSKTDHILWKWRIYNMLLGFEDIKPEHIGSHHECRLGQWYFDSATQEQLGHYDSYEHIDTPHQEVHKRAKLAAEAYQGGNMETAEKHLSELEKASAKVIANIDDLIHRLEATKER